MVMQAPLTGARPINQPAQPQAGTPHISVESSYVEGLLAKIDLGSTPEHHRFELRPATGGFDPAAVDQHPEIPVQVTTLDLHPSVEPTSEPVSAGPIEVAEGVSSLELVAGLCQFIPGLSEVANEAANEQAVLAGVA